MSLTVATWNVNSLRKRLEHLARVNAEVAPDVVCLQETKVEDKLFPADDVRAAGYEHLAFTGQKSYNGVAILSKRPITDISLDFTQGGEPDPQRRFISGTVDGVKIINLYVPNGSEVGSEKFTYKLAWLARLRAELHATCSPEQQLLLCGDINIAPTDMDVWDPFACEGKLLFTDVEKQALTGILDFGLTDAFREKNPFIQAFSWWDFRGMGFARNHGLRIDHIFVTPSLMARCTGARVFRDARTWDQPSDHTPVLATFA